MFAGRDASEMLQHSSALHPLSSTAWSCKLENNAEDRNCGVMEGYLFKRASNTFRIWNRHWFKVEDNKLTFQGFKDGPTVMMNDRRLYEVKNFNNTHHRFCFEVTSSTRAVCFRDDETDLDESHSEQGNILDRQLT